MANLNQNPSYRANIGYSGHNLSHRLSFTSSVGHLLPVLKDILQPGDKITINSVMKTRTKELASAAFTNMYDCIDYFFVPLEQIYALFGSVYFGVDDRKTSLIESKSSIAQYFPYVRTNDIFQDMESDEYFGDDYFDDFGWAGKAGALRLMEHMGVPQQNIRNMLDPEDGFFDQPLSLMWFAAYQKIFFDFYRPDDRMDNDPSYYNLDYYYASPANLPVNDRIANFFKLRYRPLGKDFYTNNYVTPIIPAGYDAISTQPQFTRSLIGSSYMNNVSNWLNPEADYSSSTYNDLGNAPTNVGEVNDFVTTASIRSIFALDKLLEITRRAGKSVDQQTLAHFGVKEFDYMRDKVRYLGTHTSDIHIGDVIATAATDAAPLGEIAGKGYGYKASDNPIKFEADKHGILLGIYSCVPEVDYTQTGYDKLLSVIERTDMPMPEYDHLGMQPFFAYQYSTTHLNIVDGTTKELVPVDNIANWQYRFYEWKSQPNLVMTGLAEYNSLGMWKPQRNFANMNLTYPRNLWYYLTPSTYLNGIMLMAYDPENASSTNMYDNDPLLHEFAFAYKKASKMSVYGLENL